MKIIQKTAAIFLACSCLFAAAALHAPQASAEGYKPPFDINSQYVYMVNTDTDTVIYESSADKPVPPASLTKIMTFILAVENIPDLENTKITAPSYIYDELYLSGASTADIRRGETVTALDLLYAMMLPSSCEAASMFADYIGGGSIPAFVDMMNAKAKVIGCKNTHFANAHGLHDPQQYSTAYDMYLITQYAMQYPIFEKVCNTPSYQLTVETTRSPNTWYIQQTNKMIVPGTSVYYEAMSGIKTGTLPEIGSNLVSTASQNGYHYMLVTMGAPLYDENGEQNYPPLSFVDAQNLYDWAFETFRIKTILEDNEIITEIPLALAEQDYVRLMTYDEVTSLLPADSDASTIQRVVTKPDSLSAPIRQGDVLGTLELRSAGETLAVVDLVAMEDVERDLWLYAQDVTARFFSQSHVQLMLGGLVVLFLLYLIAVIRYNTKKRRRAEHQRRRS